MISVYKKFLSLVIITFAIWIIVFNHDAWGKPHMKNYMGFICHNLNKPNMKNKGGFILIEIEKEDIKFEQIFFDTNKNKVRKTYKNHSSRKNLEWDYRYYKDNLTIEIIFKDDRTMFAYIDLVSSTFTFNTYDKFNCKGFRDKNIFKEGIKDIESKIKKKKFKNYYDPLFDDYLFRKNDPYNY